jgi:Natural resistance-associated macrophage protein
VNAARERDQSQALSANSGLTQPPIPARGEGDKRRIIRASNREVVVPLTLAGLVNPAMVIMAAGMFHAGHSDVAEIRTACDTLAPLLGPAAAGIFLIALLARWCRVPLLVRWREDDHARLCRLSELHPVSTGHRR